jgi:CRISPR-associated endonuclease Csn1
MKKILGLDLGSSSIGWALIQEPENDSEQFGIVGMGVRIIPLSKDENDEFSKGNAISKNASRTLKRGARRGMHRYKMRKERLKELLTSLNMMPDSALFKLSALELYNLRNRGINEQLTLKEFGRILFHLNQKRGYKSNRKANNEEEINDVGKTADTNSDVEGLTKKIKKKGYLDLIADREFLIEKNEQTIGQYFYNELLKNNFFRIKENIFMRKSYEKEFNKIWIKQQLYYPTILTEEIKNTIRDEIIYYHRPLKSQKGLVSVCEFEGKFFKDKRSDYTKEIFSGPKVAPKSSPLFQVSKIWQELNNIEITSFKALKNKFQLETDSEFNEYGKRYLTQSEKEILFEKLNWGDKISPKNILTLLGYKSGFNEFKINLRNEKFMEGNRTLSSIKKVLDQYGGYDNDLKFKLEIEDSGRPDKETGEMLHRLKDSFVDEPLYRLWHVLYSIDDPEELIKVLVTKWKYSPELAKDLTKIDFQKSGYGNMSSRALRNILPFLMNGMNYSDACEMAGYNHSNSMTKAQNEARALIDKIELYPKNSLRQPVVEKIINQVINLINDLIDEKNGFVSSEERNAKNKFEIRVELARDLRQSAEERNKSFKQNSDMDKKHKSIIEELTPLLGSVSRRDIERYKLWKEFECVSPYEPTKVISLKEVFNKVEGVLYDIEHIIPKSRLFDDSFSNKTICPRALNSGSTGKNQNTAFDFMKLQGEETFNTYVEFIKKHLYKKDGISKSKFNKLMMPVDKIPDDFINRQLQETRFISKEVRSLLEQVCRNVFATTGSVTSRLRDLWGWNDVLMNLQMEKYKSLGLTHRKEYRSNGQTHIVERINDWSKREDQRHHAIDALTVACTKQGFIQRINSINSQHTRDEIFATIENTNYSEKLSLLDKYLLKQKPFDTEKVLVETDKILISYKAGKRVASKSKNTIKTGKEQFIQSTLTPRGFLHKETVYGQIKQFEKIKLTTRFNRLNDIVDSSIKEQVTDYLQLHDNDPRKAFNSKGLSKFEEQYKYTDVTLFKQEYVVKYKLNGDFKEKDIESIVDSGVRRKVKSHLKFHGNNPKIAFNTENTVWFNEEKKISIKSVRCRTGLNDLQALHKNSAGDSIDFVSTSNNHHIAIYRGGNGKLHENVVTFWDAFERKKSGLPVIVINPKETWDRILSSGFDNQTIMKNLPKEDWIFINSLQQNEMFVFGMNRQALEHAIINREFEKISKNLYRIQKLSESDYYFRFHLETQVDDKFEGVKNESLSMKIGKMIRIRSLNNMTGIKVKINKLGRISIAEEGNLASTLFMQDELPAEL